MPLHVAHPRCVLPSPDAGSPERLVDEELVLLSSPTAPTPVERRVLHSAPADDVLVSFPWGDVPFSWANGFGTSQLPYDSCVDHSVMASFDDDDSPSYNKAKKSNERQQWEDAFHSEVKNLERFKVIGRKVPADEVPLDRDIYDIVIVCKRKRGSGKLATQLLASKCVFVWTVHK